MVYIVLIVAIGIALWTMQLQHNRRESRRERSKERFEELMERLRNDAKEDETRKQD